MRYLERAKLTQNPTAKKLFRIMEEKKTNLALSADVDKSSRLLDLADRTGPHICVLKTHIDLLDDFNEKLIEKLAALAKKHNFLLFEDRKFADIGNTVKRQYAKGIYRIADWADITNAHIVPGPGVIEGLKDVGLSLGRALLLVAEMSSKGNMANGAYTDRSVELAKMHSDFVIGFITQKKLIDDPKFIHFTPGVKFSKSGDSLGQQYNTPESVLGKNNSDIIIVGRGITEALDPKREAMLYQKAGFEIYMNRNHA